MRLKDYYRTLEMQPQATGEEIKKAFRRLALQYHPDRNADNPFAEGHFREIKEAYNILGNDKNRRKYNEERWLEGSTSHAKHTAGTTPAWLLHEAARLRAHMDKMDTYRMNQPALQQYVLFLLSDEPLDVMRRHGDAKAAGQVTEDILAATRYLRLDLLGPVQTRLLLLAGNEAWLRGMIDTVYAEREKAAAWEKRFPLMVLLFLLMIGLLVALLRLH